MLTDSNKHRPKLVVLAGPTGVGKTELAIELAEKFKADIVNADSMQVYRYMDIGTAKPGTEEQRRVTHHLIDLVDPDEDFDVAAYLKLARPLISNLDRSQTPVLVVGGTGFYLRSLLRGIFKGPGQDQSIRSRLKEEARSLGQEALHDRLAKVDPLTAARVHRHDLFRIIRALEVFELTGRTISSFQAEHGLAETPYEYIFFGLNLSREDLYARIRARTREMFAAGWIEEVEDLLARGYSSDLKPLRAIGYKQVVAYLRGMMNRSEAEAEVVKQTCRYAKRQLTWLRSQPRLVWHSDGLSESFLKTVADFWTG
ncbi:MAG: tRNA (adenosine(37)-N6)-dimethylallyltransferase MiaA [Deltaproteobacteria bacterium]|nr:tRNA (adenosine(37)-N6)-dimethylallyltransferase MiaA [Deltaproteobacteria bacterium]